MTRKREHPAELNVAQKKNTEHERAAKKARITLAPLDLAAALGAALATGPITDPELKKRRKSKR